MSRAVASAFDATSLPVLHGTRDLQSSLAAGGDHVAGGSAVALADEMDTGERRVWPRRRCKQAQR